MSLFRGLDKSVNLHSTVADNQPASDNDDDRELKEFKRYASEKRSLESWEKVSSNCVNNKALLYMEMELTVNELDRFVKDVEAQAKLRRFKRRTYSRGDWKEFRQKEQDFAEKLELGKIVMKKLLDAVTCDPDPILDEPLDEMLSVSSKLGYMRQEIDPMRQLAVIGTHVMERFARILEEEGVDHDFPVPKKVKPRKIFRRMIKAESYVKPSVPEKIVEQHETQFKDPNNIEDSTISFIKDEMFQAPASFLREYAKRADLLLEYKEVSEVKNPWITQYVYSCTLDQISAEGKGKRKSAAKQDAAAHVIRIMLNKIRRGALPQSMPVLSSEERELGLMLSCETVEYGNELQAVCSAENARPPFFIPLIQSSGNAVRCKALGFNAVGYGRTKEIASRMAAKLVLDQIRDEQERQYVSKFNFY
ncbi:uncharacterized protein LOC106664664 [Cimex lectularius]|uniref:DRBM domain-containing protein n=1 Tax=Cimex lectularius TaxID=79782 RepID=A0A8I6RJ74_CIMLE|nr:uncharacterized protein LOC106664664 [Cimex lectularius]